MEEVRARVSKGILKVDIPLSARGLLACDELERRGFNVKREVDKCQLKISVKELLEEPAEATYISVLLKSLGFKIKVEE